MSEMNTTNPTDDCQPIEELSRAGGGHYDIKVRGHLDEGWADWLGGLHIQHEEQGNSLLSGNIPDQAALYGVLAQIRDLGLMLISLTQMDVGEKG